MKNIKNVIDYFNIFSYDIPYRLLKDELLNSKNKLVKDITVALLKEKEKINYVVGFIDKSQKFKIKNSVFDKGMSCSSLKKKHFVLYLKYILKLEDNEIYSKPISDLCVLTRNALFKLELEDKTTKYFTLRL